VALDLLKGNMGKFSNSVDFVVDLALLSP